MGSSTRVPSLTLHSNGCPVSVSRAAFHFRSALLLFCSSLMFQFTSGALLSMCKPNTPYCHALRNVAPKSWVRPLCEYDLALSAGPELHAGIQDKMQRRHPAQHQTVSRKHFANMAQRHLMSCWPSKIGPERICWARADGHVECRAAESDMLLQPGPIVPSFLRLTR